jgi:hypothetical protein
MAALTRSDVSYIAALGPFKIEVIIAAAAVNGDTVTTTLANPTAAVLLAASDATGTAPSAALSGKTITLHDPSGTTDVVIVFGDSIKTAVQP